MIRLILKLVALVAAFLVAVWLFMDATTFAIAKADSATGRERGCYTVLAILLGAKSALGWEWTRYAELAASGLLVVSGVAVISAWRRSK